MSRDLQQLYQQICDEEWERYYYGRPTGYQARAAAEVGRRIGKNLIEEDWLYRRLGQCWPFGAPEWQEVLARLHSMEPAIRGNTKTFYVLRDVLIQLRGISRRLCCAMCQHRYRPDDEYREGEKWWAVLWSSSQRFQRWQWSCSRKCFRQAQKKLDKEIEWLKIAKQRQTEVRRYLRNNHAASKLPKKVSRQGMTSQI